MTLAQIYPDGTYCANMDDIPVVVLPPMHFTSDLSLLRCQCAYLEGKRPDWPLGNSSHRFPPLPFTPVARVVYDLLAGYVHWA